MAITLLRRFGPLLLSGAVGFGMATPSNAAEELRIGFVAPTTGIFAQVGKDMVDGFQMYLDDVKSDFGGPKVKFIVEDEQAKPDTAVTRAKKLILQDKIHMLIGGPAGVERLRAGARQHGRQDGLRRAGLGG
jgi:branched-chain amino acid transport system substrate-binding protein